MVRAPSRRDPVARGPIVGLILRSQLIVLLENKVQILFGRAKKAPRYIENCMVYLSSALYSVNHSIACNEFVCEPEGHIYATVGKCIYNYETMHTAQLNQI